MSGIYIKLAKKFVAPARCGREAARQRIARPSACTARTKSGVVLRLMYVTDQTDRPQITRLDTYRIIGTASSNARTGLTGSDSSMVALIPGNDF